MNSTNFCLAAIFFSYSYDLHPSSYPNFPYQLAESFIVESFHHFDRLRMLSIMKNIFNHDGKVWRITSTLMSFSPTIISKSISVTHDGVKVEFSQLLTWETNLKLKRFSNIFPSPYRFVFTSTFTPPQLTISNQTNSSSHSSEQHQKNQHGKFHR